MRHTFDPGSNGWFYVIFFVVLLGACLVRFNVGYSMCVRSLFRPDNWLSCVGNIEDFDVHISNERSRESPLSTRNGVPERAYWFQL